MRLFTAILLPDEIRECISSICHGIPAVRWAKEDSLHLTLAFLGEIKTELFLDLAEALSEIKLCSFPIEVRGVGQFLNAKDINTLWAGINENKNLTHLQNEITHVVKKFGIATEKRKYLPHISIGKIRKAKMSEVRDYLDAFVDFKCEEFLTESFYLMSSKLYPEGPVHTIERNYELVV